MSKAFLLGGLAFALAVITIPGNARAQNAEAALESARGHFDKGQTLFEQGNFAEAARQFQQAYEARPYAQFLFNAAACFEKSGDYADAIEHYEKYLAAQPEATDRASVERRISALRKGLAEIDARPVDPNAAPDATAATPAAVQGLDEVAVRGLVVIESEPQGATIYLDSKKSSPLSKTPWNGSITGEHTIMLEREGYKSVERRLRPDPNALNILYFHLSEEDYLGWVDITSNVPGADIYIDDKSVGVYSKTPYSGNLTPGKHEVWVTKPGYDEFHTTVNVVAGQTHKIDAAIEGSEVGYLNIRGSGVDKVSVYVDGKLLCKKRACREALPPGKHTVTFKRSDHKPYTAVIDMQSKTEVTMRARLAEEPGRADAIIAYLFAGAFIGGGVYAGVQAKNLEDELADEIAAGNPPPDSDDPRFLRGKIWAISADAAYVLGGVSMAAAIYYTFRDKGADSTGTVDVSAVTFAPHVAPGYAGVGMGMSF